MPGIDPIVRRPGPEMPVPASAHRNRNSGGVSSLSAGRRFSAFEFVDRLPLHAPASCGIRALNLGLSFQRRAHYFSIVGSKEGSSAKSTHPTTAPACSKFCRNAWGTGSRQPAVSGAGNKLVRGIFVFFVSTIIDHSTDRLRSFLMPYQERSEKQDRNRGKKARTEEKHVPQHASAALPNSLVLRSMADQADGSAPASPGFRHELSHTIRHNPAPVRPVTAAPYGVIQRVDDDRKIPGGEAPDRAEAPAAAAPAAAAAEPEAPEEESDEWTRVAEQPEEPGTAGLENKILTTFTCDPTGMKVYAGIKSDLKKWIKAGTGREDIKLDSDSSAVRFLVRAAYGDYIARDILQVIAAPPVGDKDEKDRMIRSFKALIKQVSERAGKDDLEFIAEDLGMLPGSDAVRPGPQAPEKRAYELSPDAPDGSGTVTAASRGNRALQKVFDKIDHARTPIAAYRAFAAYTGNMDAKLNDRVGMFRSWNNIDKRRFCARLKQMVRMVRDYPELRHKIGDMYDLPAHGGAIMETGKSFRGGYRATIGFDPSGGSDQAIAPDDLLSRALFAAQQGSDPLEFHIAPREYDGTHELGHVLSGTLVDEKKDPIAAAADQKKGKEEGEVLEDAIAHNMGMMLSVYHMPRSLRRYQHDDEDRGQKKGQIDTKDPLFTQDPKEREPSRESLMEFMPPEPLRRPDPREAVREDPLPEPGGASAFLDLADPAREKEALERKLMEMYKKSLTPDQLAAGMAQQRRFERMQKAQEADRKASRRRSREEFFFESKPNGSKRGWYDRLSARKDPKRGDWYKHLAESSERARMIMLGDREQEQAPQSPEPRNDPRDRTLKPTSGYGSTNVAELFAEAFADVYAHGNRARPMSIAIVKEYEAKQKQRQRQKFDQDSKGFWKRLFG